jgi:hypothetical protein
MAYPAFCCWIIAPAANAEDEPINSEPKYTATDLRTNVEFELTLQPPRLF